ncbi:MAG TPA: hypothetical protein VJP40_01760 [bacterium]|nr:hypothetical protein [bacterium]
MGHISAIPGFRDIYASASIAPPALSATTSQISTAFLAAASPSTAVAVLALPPLLKLFAALPMQLKVATPAASLPTASAKVLADVALIEKKLKTSVYNANTKVDLLKGNFEFDCSGMVDWILERSAPTAFAELKAERPRVIEYVKALKAIPANQPSAGWRRIAKIADAEPGDIVAWPTPDWYPSSATGHMGILVAAPEAVDGGFLLRLADSTSYPHGDDSREGGTGFGYGTVLITVDAKTGAGTGQGWTGRHSYNTVLETPIYVGRPLK